MDVSYIIRGFRNCAIYCGASVDFVDVNVKTGNISVSKLEVKLKQAAKLGVTPKALIVVHLGGFLVICERFLSYPSCMVLISLRMRVTLWGKI